MGASLKVESKRDSRFIQNPEKHQNSVKKHHSRRCLHPGRSASFPCSCRGKVNARPQKNSSENRRRTSHDLHQNHRNFHQNHHNFHQNHRNLHQNHHNLHHNEVKVHHVISSPKRGEYSPQYRSISSTSSSSSQSRSPPRSQPSSPPSQTPPSPKFPLLSQQIYPQKCCVICTEVADPYYETLCLKCLVSMVSRRKYGMEGYPDAEMKPYFFRGTRTDAHKLLASRKASAFRYTKRYFRTFFECFDVTPGDFVGLFRAKIQSKMTFFFSSYYIRSCHEKLIKNDMANFYRLVRVPAWL